MVAPATVRTTPPVVICAMVDPLVPTDRQRSGVGERAKEAKKRDGTPQKEAATVYKNRHRHRCRGFYLRYPEQGTRMKEVT